MSRNTETTRGLSPHRASTRPATQLLTIAVLTLAMALAAANTFAAPQPDDPATVARLEALSRQLAREAEERRGPLYHQLLAQTDGPQGRLNADRDIELIGVDVRGFPLFYSINNLISARSISTDEVWPGGSTGLALTGANSTGDFAVWDAASALVTHQEFGGRISIGDSSSDTHYHSTHVAGTLVGSGFDPDAKGMSYVASLISYDWSDDESEMAAAGANGLLVSSHSYGYVTGWYQQRSEPYEHYWYGEVEIDPNEDPGFGFYSSGARDWDEVAYNAPYYLIFKSAGNDRNDYGPEEGEGHYYYDPDTGWTWSTVERAADGGDTGYDTVSYNTTAKNIMTIGAVEDVPGGYSAPGDVVMSTFSGWGPTDDGRIKPDIVTNGVGLYSAMDDADDAYESLSGTSMASPSAAGAAHLLVQQYRSLHSGTPMLAATLKALIIHTADEAGTADGPDYSFGWGMMNTQTAAELIHDDAAGGNRIFEETLADGQADSTTFFCDGSEPVVVTITWSDPAGTPPVWSLDPPDLMLVHDLDLRLERMSDSATFTPWILDPANPAAPATTGDNFRDNTETVRIAAPEAGYYRVVVSHKNSLTTAQDYGMIVSGFGPGPIAPEVSNVAFAQRTDGSGLVDIVFDLTDPDSPVLDVTLEASDDGGTTWTFPITAVTGDIGSGVSVGSARNAVWDFGSEHPGVFDSEFQIRITAQDDS